MTPTPRSKRFSNKYSMDLETDGTQLLPRKEGRFRLPRIKGGPWLQDQSRLGQDHPSTRYVKIECDCAVEIGTNECHR